MKRKSGEFWQNMFNLSKKILLVVLYNEEYHQQRCRVKNCSGEVNYLVQGTF